MTTIPPTDPLERALYLADIEVTETQLATLREMVAYASQFTIDPIGAVFATVFKDYLDSRMARGFRKNLEAPNGNDDAA